MISRKSDDVSQFELVVQVRDSSGNSTGKIKTLQTNDASELESFWNRNAGTPKERKKKKSGSKTSTHAKNVILKELEKLSQLEKDWDNRGGVPLNYQTYLVACNVVSSLSDVIPFKPRVIAMTDGRAQLEFVHNKNNKELEIEFTDPQTIRYLIWDPNNNFSEEASLGINETRKLRDVMVLFNKN